MFYFSNAYGHIDIFDDNENIDTILNLLCI